MKKLFAVMVLIIAILSLGIYADTTSALDERLSVFENLSFSEMNSNNYFANARRFYDAILYADSIYDPFDDDPTHFTESARNLGKMESFPECALTNEYNDLQNALVPVSTLVNSGNWKSIESLLSKYTNLFPWSGDVHYYLGQYYYKSQKLIPALNHLRLSLWLTDEHPDTLYILGNLYDQRFYDTAAAIKYYEEYLNTGDREFRREVRQTNNSLTKWQAHCNAGEILVRNGDYSNARCAFNEALNIRPLSSRARTGLGRALIGENQKALGMQEIMKAMQITSMSPRPAPEPFYWMAYHYAADGQISDAFDIIKYNTALFTGSWRELLETEDVFRPLRLKPEWSGLFPEPE